MRLTGKTVVVTGGGTGLGRGLTLAFAQEGASVLICGRREGPLAETVQEIEARGGQAVCMQADLAKPEEAQAVALEVERRWARLDVLVNNASILGPMAPLADYPVEAWDEVIQINMSSVFYLTKALIPLMIRADGGSIINVTSTVGRRGRMRWGAYAVSKAGLENLTQTLAEELAPHGVRVNAVNPGGTRTAMRAMACPDEDPMSLPTPDQVAPVFVYLASDESRAVTGQSLDARSWCGLT